MTDYRELILRLVAGRVEFIIVGGAAAIAHGASRLTEDLDIVYRRNQNNVERIVESLAPFAPYPRGAPEGLPFRWEAETIWHGLNFTLTTSLGPLDLFAEITLGGTFDDLLPHTVALEIFHRSCLCLGLERLIEVTRCRSTKRLRRDLLSYKRCLKSEDLKMGTLNIVNVSLMADRPKGRQAYSAGTSPTFRGSDEHGNYLGDVTGLDAAEIQIPDAVQVERLLLRFWENRQHSAIPSIEVGSVCRRAAQEIFRHHQLPTHSQ